MDFGDSLQVSNFTRNYDTTISYQKSYTLLLRWHNLPKTQIGVGLSKLHISKNPQKIKRAGPRGFPFLKITDMQCQTYHRF